MDERSEHEVAVVGIDAFHDVPRCGIGTRPVNHLLSDGGHTVVPSQSSPLQIGDSPTRQRILLERLQAFPLRGGIQIEEEFQNDRTVVSQCLPKSAICSSRLAKAVLQQRRLSRARTAGSYHA
jgi:hypothetical protein